MVQKERMSSMRDPKRSQVPSSSNLGGGAAMECFRLVGALDYGRTGTRKTSQLRLDDLLALPGEQVVDQFFQLRRIHSFGGWHELAPSDQFPATGDDLPQVVFPKAG